MQVSVDAYILSIGGTARRLSTVEGECTMATHAVDVNATRCGAAMLLADGDEPVTRSLALCEDHVAAEG
jgi:hypothetical protein